MRNITHVASFIGNLGDVYSNAGFIQFLDQYETFNINRIEIRRLYKNYAGNGKISFNNVLDSFKNDENEMMIVGGGGFFDYWVPYTSTGTTFDIDYDLLRKIKKPILFSSLGAHPHKEVPKENYHKFRQFLDHIRGQKNLALMFRNDGTIDSLNSSFNDLDTSWLYEGADHSFLYSPQYLAKIDDKFICVNIAPDQLLMKSQHRKNEICEDMYYKKIANSLVKIADHLECKIIFVPHLHHDLEAAYNLTKFMPDIFIRSRYMIAEFDPSGRHIDKVFMLYRNAIMNICSRYHSNIMSICSGSATISLPILDRVRSLAAQFSTCTIWEDCQYETLSMLSNEMMMPTELINKEIELRKNKIATFFEPYLN